MDIVISIKNEAFRQKISLADIARKLEMTPQNFNNILKTESIKFVLVQKIAHVLDVNIDYLLKEETISAKNHTNNFVENAEILKLTYFNQNIDTEHLKIIERMQNQIDYLIETNRKLIT